MGRNVLESSLQSGLFNIIFQVFFRCITFFLNAFIVRRVGHDVLAIMNVRLLLLESTILFLSKEPISRACLSKKESQNWAQVVNQIWLSVPVSVLPNTFLIYIWLNVLSPVEDVHKEQYEFGCYSVGISCVIEQISQNAVLLAQKYCFVKLRVVLETLRVLSRTFIFVFLVIGNPNRAIYAFSIAQVASSLLLCGCYYVFFAWYTRKLKECKNSGLKLFEGMDDFKLESIWDFLPFRMVNKEKALNADLSILTVSFVKQSVVKQVLTEGEKYVMTISPVMNFVEQSMYDIVNNLGSLAARFIFRPIEENAYLYFTEAIKRNVSVNKQDKNVIAESVYVLQQLCNAVLSVGLTICVFGQSYSYALLYLYGGQKLVDNLLSVVLLRAHCFAIVLIAVNGVTEGFVTATMSVAELEKYNYWMILFSVMFLLFSYLLTVLLGPVGFIFANCLNMFARIVHSLLFIQGLYINTTFNPLEGLKPTWKFLGVLIVSGCCTKLSENFVLEKSLILHILIGGVFFVFTISVWAYDNQSLVKLGYNKYVKRYVIKQKNS